MRFVVPLVLLAPLAVVTHSAAQSAQTPRIDVHGDPLPEGAIARLGSMRFQPAIDRSSLPAALSPDGKLVVMVDAYDSNSPIHCMETASGKITRTVRLEAGTVNVSCDRICLTADGKSCLLISATGVVFVDTATGKIAKAIDTGARDVMAVSADGKFVAGQRRGSPRDAPVDILDASSGQEIATLPGRGTYCQQLRFNDDGKRLLLLSAPSTNRARVSPSAVACIDIGTRKIIGAAIAPASTQVALCPDGETVALEDVDFDCARVRHLPSGTERCAIPVKQPKLAFAPNGKTLLTIDHQGAAALWDAGNGAKIRDLDGVVAGRHVHIIGISDDGKTVAVLDGGAQSIPKIVVWNVDTGKRASRPPSHESAVICLAYAPSGELLVSGSLDKTVRLWNPATGQHVRKLADHEQAVTAVAFSADGAIVASASRDGITRISKVADGKLMAELSGPEQGVTALAFARDDKTLFAGGAAAGVTMPQVVGWEIASGKEIMRFTTGHGGAVMALADAGSFAVTANGEIRAKDKREHLQVWNPPEKIAVASIPLRNEGYGAVLCEAAALSPDGRLLASSQVWAQPGFSRSYGAPQLRVWERASGQVMTQLPPAVVKVLAFSLDGAFLAAGGRKQYDGVSGGDSPGIDIWDLRSGAKVSSLAGSPECISFSPDGLHIATGGRDNSVLIWPAPRREVRKQSKPPSPQERDRWWIALGGRPDDAYQAMGKMIDAPDHAVTLLKQRLEPSKPVAPEAIAKLIAQLDSKSYSERQNAQTALENMEQGATPLVKQTLEKNISLEMRRRLEALLERSNTVPNSALRHHRAVATLERIGNPAACAVLKSLAAGTPGARLTVEAQAALKRVPP